MPKRRVYGIEWSESEDDPLQIELFFIQQGGYHWKGPVRYGYGKYFHYRQMMTLLWPDDDHHRWSDLILKRKCKEDILVLMGPADSNKTYASARYVLCDYWAFPNNTLWMFSTTEQRGAELRLWGKMKELINRARERYSWLPGRVLESKTCITTEDLSGDGEEARLLTKGIVFIPCKSGENWVGLGAYAGIKPPKGGRLGHFGDEVSYMERSLLQAYANWYGKPNFQGILTGNPAEIDDPLCTAAEPVDGWDDWHDSKKTQEWRSKWYGAWVIAFDGRDSPNFDYDPKLPSRYPYLISRKKLSAVAIAEGPESALYYMQCIGKPIPGQAHLRIFTVTECEQAHAFESVIWSGGPFLHIVGLDAAYSGEGGDRCVAILIKCGRAVGGRNVIEVHKPEIVPVSVINPEKPDIQIAKWVRSYCLRMGVPPENMGFDGRATLALSFAAVWSSQVVAIDFNGPATDRPVSNQHFVEEEKDGHRVRRPKRWDEHVRKFVTELWFAVPYLMRGGQLRGLPREIAEEGSRRRWKPVAGSLMELETKKDMKLRTKQSPDLTDALVTAIEVARRRGFVIDIETVSVITEEEEWLKKAADAWRSTVRKSEVKYGS